MRAIELVEAHSMRLVELDEPEPEPGEVLLRVEACGVCGSDVSSYKLGLSTGVMGHEIAGRLERGGLVAIDPKVPCGQCEDCRTGHENRCIDTLTKPVLRPGGYAEWLVAPKELVYELPAEVPASVGALAEPLSVAVHAVSRSDIGPGTPALVVGLGSIGLLTAIALKAAGAAPIIAVEPNAARRELGERLGVQRAVASAGQARTSLDRVPVVIECSGRPEALQTAVDMADSGGTVVLAGIAVAEVNLTPVFLITRELRVLGSITATHADFRRAVELLPEHPELAEITTPVGLEELPELFERLAAGEVPPAKPLVLP